MFHVDLVSECSCKQDTRHQQGVILSENMAYLKLLIVQSHVPRDVAVPRELPTLSAALPGLVAWAVGCFKPNRLLVGGMQDVTTGWLLPFPLQGV